jgi:CRISPR-associated protein Cas2
MMVLVTYDVSTLTSVGRRRLAKVAKACESYGQRVQNSVFECELDPAKWERLKTRLQSLVKPEEDSLRFYHLGSNWERRVEHFGAKPAWDMHDALIV